MKHSLEKDRKYLTWNNQRGIAHVISRGYRWLKEKYLPAIHRLENAGLRKDCYLLGWCYYMIGDIHDFNECPKAAIKAYQKSFAIDSENAAALREIGNMYERIGQYKKAVSHLKKSLQIDPIEENAISDYESAKFSGGTPLYQKDDACWQAREYLAQDKPQPAITLLSKKRSNSAFQIMACAFGILNHTDAYLEQYRKICKTKESIEMRFIDWFYMTKTVWNCSDFWQCIAECAKHIRFRYGVWPMSESLWYNTIPFPKHRKNKQSDIKRCNKRVVLLAQYHIARINNDNRLAETLSKQYPNWIEIAKLYHKLSC